MASSTPLVKRSLSGQELPGDEPLSSPAKRRRVNSANSAEKMPIETTVASEGLRELMPRTTAETEVLVERTFSLRSVLEDDDLPIVCNCPPLRGRSDYRIWRRKMRLILSRNLLLDLVDGKIGQLPQSHYLESQLDSLNEAARKIINTNLSATTRLIVRNIRNPQKMWEKLEKHCKPSDWSLVRSGWLELQNIKYSQCRDIWEYVYKVDDAWRCICLDQEDTLEKHEVARCTSLMCSLDTPKWETWKMGFLSSRDTNIPSWASLVESLTSAEDKGIVSDLIGIAI
ncbi:hypothetical protein N7489_004273 [Penicillium chrysogenum]|jgi:hypothetical protein|uniref:Retrotransposon Copia-like N-terminal domain-containing protein n=1 Tax=Penicillium chrysogenum TaxID=5076 RepID=A0ABQ8WRV4_PENCH|nr:uncharacterized protein N7489_004273 [Penicillium chrysogenum]KAJ5244177.1 hypothetical protein N7489_004273 [Penicillium chrysogenum]KAJ5275195.1 hypothetical protein N7505_003740 [Penicillium chrysogenum]KAJ6156924.1 hypothetical protein N7497_005809 [Penicillium chrysogenum]